MVKVTIGTVGAHPAIEAELPAVPRIGEGLFFGPGDEQQGRNRHEVTDVVYTESNGEWTIMIVASPAPRPSTWIG